MDNKPFLLDLFTSPININFITYTVFIEEMPKPPRISNIIESSNEATIHDAIESIREEWKKLEEYTNSVYTGIYRISIFKYSHVVGYNKGCTTTNRKLIIYKQIAYDVIKLHEELKRDKYTQEIHLKQEYSDDEFIKLFKEVLGNG